MGQQVVTMNGKRYSQGPGGQLVEIGNQPASAPVALPEQPSLAALAGEGGDQQPSSVQQVQSAPDSKLMPYALMALQGLTSGVGR